MADTSVVGSPEVEAFGIALEEAARASESSASRFVEPAKGTLSRTLSSRHHLIFGRRGSGKTSLLQKARADLLANRRPNAFIDMEKFKAHSYPDVLISVLIETFENVQGWLEEGAVAPASKKSFWQRVKPTRKPLKRSESELLAAELGGHITELHALLHAQDGADIEILHRGERATHDSLSGGIGASKGPVRAHIDATSEMSQSQLRETKESLRRSKIDHLQRRVLDYQRTLKRIVKLSGQDGFVLLDDMYYIRRSDQPDVLDYFHRLFKGSGLWLKVGTIRHRSQWYRHGDPPIGMKLGDDVDEIDLDLTLEKYQTAKAFLIQIASEIAAESDVSISNLINEGARDRMVLASGGVARDFLSILRRSLAIAAEQSHARVDVASVNQAAGEHESTKRDEFRRDVIDGQDELETSFEKIKDFCFERKMNCFTVEKDLAVPEYEKIKELVDLRLVHAINSRVTVFHRTGKIYEAYMLDLSQYAGERKRRNMQMLEFWKKDDEEKLRGASLIYLEAAVAGS